MHAVHELLLQVHVVAGFTALVLFWVPALTRKGGRLHVRSGWLYVAAMTLVVITAIVLSLGSFIAPLAVRGITSPTPEQQALVPMFRNFATFLLYLALITFSGGWHGLRVLRAKRDPAGLRTTFNYAIHAACIAASGVVVILGIVHDSTLLLVLSPIGFLDGFAFFKLVRKPSHDRMYWWFEHFGGMIGTGIAAHTAFLVFGASRLWPQMRAEGLIGIIPWIAPTIIGIAAAAWLDKHYRRRFGEQTMAPPQSIAAPELPAA